LEYHGAIRSGHRDRNTCIRGSTRAWSASEEVKMKNLALALTLIFAATFVVSCTPSGDPKSYPKIVIDQEHHEGTPENEGGAKPYSISATAGVIVDLSSYQFQVPEGAGVTAPNAIHVGFGINRDYHVAMKPGVTQYVLDSTTLKQLPGSARYKGFRPGDFCSLAIGVETIPSSSNEPVSMKPMWYGRIEVKK
jgi:hypothetical protein